MIKINWKRVALALVFSPPLGLILFFAFLAIPEWIAGDTSFKQTLSLLFLIPVFGSIIAYPFMFILGIPTLLYFEVKRYAIKKSIIIGVLIASLTPLFFALALGENDFYLYGIAGFSCSIFVCLFMYYKRDDW